MKSPSLTLAERLADRICHDFAGAAQAVASGLDLLRESHGPAEREEAEAFLAEAVAVQRSKIGFARRAYGPGSASIGGDELKSLVESLFVGGRAQLEWRNAAPELTPAASRALLVLTQLVADLLAAGGLARVVIHSMGAIEIDAEGPRAALREEVKAGLTGGGDTGLGGRWAQAAFVHALTCASDGELEIDERQGGVRFSLRIPTDA